MSDTKQRIRAIILREYLPGEDPSSLLDDTPLITGGILDSVSTLKFVTEIEEEFGIELSAREAESDRLDSVLEILRLVESKLS